MKIKISYPNDYQSDDDYLAAIDDCGDDEDSILERLAESAGGAGLKFIRRTDYGAIWEGSEEQIKEAKDNLPAWTYYGYFEE